LADAVETPVCEANGIPGVQGKSEDGTACCALTCKNDDGELECGGEQCGLRDKEGGKSSCCIKEIIDHGPSCDERGATSPCSICERLDSVECRVNFFLLDLGSNLASWMYF